MSYQSSVAADDNTEAPVSLSAERTRKFFRSLAEDAFLALVVTEDGEVRIFSKDIEEDHLARIREVLTQIQQEE